MRTLCIALCAVALCVSGAHAEVTALVCSLDGAQANAGAGTGSAGTGSATISYDSETGELSWNLSWSGLTGTPTLCHFHGPALTDQNAGVQVDIFAISGSTSPSIGSTVIDAGQAADLLNDLWYINLHTTEVAGGEIRGQVLVDDAVPVQDNSVSQMKSAYE